jgi:hypothetical protein
VCKAYLDLVGAEIDVIESGTILHESVQVALELVVGQVDAKTM